jgi:putative methanogen marker protein 4
MRPGQVGIGVKGSPDRIIASISRLANPGQVIAYIDPTLENTVDFPCRIIVDQDPGSRMIDDLSAGKIRAAVRGTLPASSTLSVLKKTFQVSELERIVLLEIRSGRKFFLAPVGIDEGWTISQKLSLIKQGREIAEKFGLSDMVGIVSGGRLNDIGRNPVVDRSLADAELIASLSHARHYEILIEDAVQECGLIIAPDGITGNLIFRTLVFIGNGVSHGAPVLNINKIFVDTSRGNQDYSNALILASAMAE